MRERSLEVNTFYSVSLMPTPRLSESLNIIILTNQTLSICYVLLQALSVYVRYFYIIVTLII